MSVNASKHHISFLIVFFFSPFYALFDNGGDSALKEMAYLWEKIQYEYIVEDIDTSASTTVLKLHSKAVLPLDFYYLNLFSFSFQEDIEPVHFSDCSILMLAKQVFLKARQTHSNYLSFQQQRPQQALHLLYDVFLI